MVQDDSKPPVTVVIPAYNLAEYLADAIHSVASQTYSGDVKIIVLDDGSQDETLTVAQRHAAERKNLSVYSQSNLGRVATRNRLLQLATTEMVAWLDGDDIASNQWLEEQVDRLVRDPQCVAVSAQGYAMTAHRRPIGPIDHPCLSHEIERRHLEGQANAFFQSCVTVRKSAVVSAGAYRDKYPAGEDFDLWLRLSELGQLQNLSTVHLCYRVHPSSANSTISVEQRRQGRAIVEEARSRRGLPPLPAPPVTIPPNQRDDWHRRIYWINIALKSGNPRTALELLGPALTHHPRSLLLWLFTATALFDSLLLFGNRTETFRPGGRADIGRPPRFSMYVLARKLYRLRHAIRERCKSNSFSKPYRQATH